MSNLRYLQLKNGELNLIDEINLLYDTEAKRVRSASKRIFIAFKTAYIPSSK